MLQRGDTLFDGEFVVDDLVGKGACSNCYQCERYCPAVSDDATVVLKVRRTSTTAWFDNEFDLLSTIPPHPSVIRLLGYFEDGVHEAMMLPVYDCCLAQWLSIKKKAVVTPRCRGWLRQTAQALQHLHANGFIHRDVKLGNILLDFSHRRVVLADFEFATTLTGGHDLTRRVGTPNYIAPEVLEGSYSFGADLWSLGVVAVTLFTGSRPFQQSNSRKRTYAAILKMDWEFPAELVLPPTARSFCRALLQPRPARPTATKILEHPFFAVGVDVSETNKETPDCKQEQ
jgi:calcium-dependent protein kinase